MDTQSDLNRPNYRPPIWNYLIRRLERARDWCDDLSREDIKAKYLIQLPGELDQDYKVRLQSEDPEPYFADAIESHASLFQQFELAKDSPRSLQKLKNNIDGAGSDIWQWAGYVLKALFRDGGALIGVDIPPAETEDDLRQFRRPRLIFVPLKDLYAPRYRQAYGLNILDRISIKRTSTRLVGNAFKPCAEYWVYELNENLECFVSVWVEINDRLLQEQPPRAILTASKTPLKRLPFVDNFNFVGTLDFDEERQLISPFNALVSLNIEHYNLKSKLNTVLGKTALPTPIRYWENGVPDQLPPFYAGSGKSQDYSAGSRVEYLELKGESIPALREQLNLIESKIAKRDNKLFHLNGVARSATEANIENQKSKAGLPAIKLLVESTFQDLFVLWELFANPDYSESSPIGSIIISDEVLRQPPAPDEVRATLETVHSGVASTEMALNRLVRIGFYEEQDLQKGDNSNAI